MLTTKMVQGVGEGRSPFSSPDEVKSLPAEMQVEQRPYYHQSLQNGAHSLILKIEQSTGKQEVLR